MEMGCLSSMPRAFEVGELSNSALMSGSSFLRRSRLSSPSMSSGNTSSCVLVAPERFSFLDDAASSSSSSSRLSLASSSSTRLSLGAEDFRIRMAYGDAGARRRLQRWARRVISSPSETAPVSSDEEISEANSAVDSTQKKFVWKSNWYPVIAEWDLDKSVPHPFQILGRKVVIWYDRNSEQWKTFSDVCPHRLAPLSEGRIDETGCIQCCYHGWSFGGDGTCTRIPQARNEGPESSAAGKVSVPSFPTMVRQNILFIWPDENEKFAHEIDPPYTPEHDVEGFTTVAIFRDMDYGWDTAMENLLDPSHLPIAHHAVNGSRFVTRDNAKPLNTELSGLTQRGFSSPWGHIDGPLQQIVFEAPARNTYIFSRDGKLMRTTTTYATPTAPGKCRIIIENGLSKDVPWLFKATVSGTKWWQIVPRWWDHQKMLNLLDGDESLLHYQERILRDVTNGQVENWSKAFHMPTSADRFVSGLRQWINRFGGKGVAWADGVDPALPPLIEDKRVLLDRYNSHTEKCLVCRKALENFKLARTVLFVVAGLLVGAAPLLNVWSRRIPLVVAAGICALAGWRIQVEWIPMFYYKGYDHARIP